MILTILWPFIRAEWRYIALFVLLGGLYYLIYSHGYHSCESDVAEAKAIATKEAQAIADVTQKKLAADNAKEKEYSKKLEVKLDEEIKKHQYTDCIVPRDGLRLLNKALR